MARLSWLAGKRSSSKIAICTSLEDIKFQSDVSWATFSAYYWCVCSQSSTYKEWDRLFGGLYNPLMRYRQWFRLFIILHVKVFFCMVYFLGSIKEWRKNLIFQNVRRDFSITRAQSLKYLPVAFFWPVLSPLDRSPTGKRIEMKEMYESEVRVGSKLSKHLFFTVSVLFVVVLCDFLLPSFIVEVLDCCLSLLTCSIITRSFLVPVIR
jgi:hypothetical protein